jgi:hypothetical protein
VRAAFQHRLARRGSTGGHGLALHLAGDAEPGDADLENLVLQDLAWRDTRLERAEVLYWRTAIGEEVDSNGWPPDVLAAPWWRVASRRSILGAHDDREAHPWRSHCRQP